MQEPHTVTLNVILCDSQAWAYAQFLKRVGLNDYAALATDRPQAYAMLAAGEAIREELERAGYAPR